jgi:hypothetical protein
MKGMCSLKVRKFTGPSFSRPEKFKRNDYTLIILQRGRVIARHVCERVDLNTLYFDCIVDCSTEGMLELELHKRSSVPLLREKQRTKYVGQCHMIDLLPTDENRSKESWISMAAKCDKRIQSSKEPFQSANNAQLHVELMLPKSYENDEHPLSSK